MHRRTAYAEEMRLDCPMSMETWLGNSSWEYQTVLLLNQQRMPAQYRVP